MSLLMSSTKRARTADSGSSSLSSSGRKKSSQDEQMVQLPKSIRTELLGPAHIARYPDYFEGIAEQLRRLNLPIPSTPWRYEMVRFSHLFEPDVSVVFPGPIFVHALRLSPSYQMNSRTYELEWEVVDARDELLSCFLKLGREGHSNENLTSFTQAWMHFEKMYILSLEAHAVIALSPLTDAIKSIMPLRKSQAQELVLPHPRKKEQMVFTLRALACLCENLGLLSVAVLGPSKGTAKIDYRLLVLMDEVWRLSCAYKNTAQPPGAFGDETELPPLPETPPPSQKELDEQQFLTRAALFETVAISPEEQETKREKVNALNALRVPRKTEQVDTAFVSLGKEIDAKFEKNKQLVDVINAPNQFAKKIYIYEPKNEKNENNHNNSDNNSENENNNDSGHVIEVKTISHNNNNNVNVNVDENGIMNTIVADIDDNDDNNNDDDNNNNDNGKLNSDYDKIESDENDLNNNFINQTKLVSPTNNVETNQNINININNNNNNKNMEQNVGKMIKTSLSAGKKNENRLNFNRNDGLTPEELKFLYSSSFSHQGSFFSKSKSQNGKTDSANEIEEREEEEKEEDEAIPIKADDVHLSVVSPICTRRLFQAAHIEEQFKTEMSGWPMNVEQRLLSSHRETLQAQHHAERMRELISLMPPGYLASPNFVIREELAQNQQQKLNSNNNNNDHSNSLNKGSVVSLPQIALSNKEHEKLQKMYGGGASGGLKKINDNNTNNTKNSRGQSMSPSLRLTHLLANSLQQPTLELMHKIENPRRSEWLPPWLANAAKAGWLSADVPRHNYNNNNKNGFNKSDNTASKQLALIQATLPTSQYLRQKISLHEAKQRNETVLSTGNRKLFVAKEKENSDASESTVLIQPGRFAYVDILKLDPAAINAILALPGADVHAEKLCTAFNELRALLEGNIKPILDKLNPSIQTHEALRSALEKFIKAYKIAARNYLRPDCLI